MTKTALRNAGLVLGLAVILGYAPNPAYADCTISSFTITCDVGSGNTDTYASDIADSSFPTNLVKTGYGKQILSSTNNTYTGDTTVTSGTLAAGATNAFSEFSYTTVNDAALDINGYNQKIDVLQGFGTVKNDGSSDATLTVGGFVDSTFSGIMMDGVSKLALTKNGVSTFILSGIGEYSGATTINAGTLQAGSATAFSSASAFVFGDFATLDIHGYNVAVGSLSGTGLVTNNGLSDATITVGDDNTDTTFDGGLSDGGTNKLGLVKEGLGTLTLSSTNTYSGGTTISGGTLSISADDNLGTGGVTFNTGGILLTTAGFSSSKSFTFNAGGGVIDTNGHTITLSGATSGSDGLTVQGGGTLELTHVYGDGDHGAPVNLISHATLSITNNNQMGLDQNGTSVDGGTLKTAAAITTSRNFIIGADGFTMNTNGFSSTFNGYLVKGSGSGGLTVTGGGTMTLTAWQHGGDQNTYVGDTTINDATLSINDDLQLGDLGGGITLNGGVLQALGVLSARSVTLGSGGGTIDVAGNSSAFSGLISGVDGLTLADSVGGGSVVLSHANTYTGGTLISGGTASITDLGALGAGDVTLAGGTLDINVENGTFANNIVLSTGNGTITSVNNAVTELSGGIFGSHNITFASEGDTSTSTWFYLTGTSNYTGTTTIHNASVKFDSVDRLSSNTINLTNGALIVNDDITVANHIVISGAGKLDGNGTHSVTFSGLISGTGDLYIDSANTITLGNASNSYVGNTIVNNSILTIANSSDLGDSSGHLILRGGTLRVPQHLAISRSIDVGDSGGTLDSHGWQINMSGIIGDDSSAISAGALTLTDATMSGGSIVLYGVNTYTGGTIIQDVFAEIYDDSALGNSSGNVKIRNGTLLARDNLSSSRSLSLGNGGGTLDSNGHQITWSGAIGDDSFADTPGALTVADSDGGGIVTLTHSNTYTGGTIINGGILAITDDGQLGSGGSVTLNGGTLRVNEVNSARAFYINTGGGTIDTNGDDSTITGVIGDGNGSGALTKTGSGTLSLTNTNTYTGGTTISGGIVSISNVAALGSGDVTLTGGTLNIHVADGNLTNHIVLGTDDSQITSLGNLHVAFLSGGISGNHNVTFASEDSSVSRLILSGTNTYTGTTTINNAEVIFDTADKLSSNTIYLNTGYLQAGDGITVANDIVINNVGKLTGGEGNSATYTGLISGTGDLYIESAGVITLSNTGNSYVGNTYITSATLAISDDANLGNTNIGEDSSSIIFDSGTLRTNADITSSRTITINAGGGAIDVKGHNNTFSGLISGAGGLDIESSTSPGSVTLSHANTYGGSTTVGFNAILRWGNDNQLGNGTTIISNSGTFSATADITSSRNFNINTIGLGVDGHYLTFNGAWNGGGIAYIMGGGVLELNHDNTEGFGGTYEITGGTMLAIHGDNNLGSNTAVFHIGNGGIRTLANMTMVRDITIGGGGQTTIDTYGNDVTLSGTISGTGDFLKKGLGTLTLSGVVDSTEIVAVYGGTLRAGADGVFHDTATLYMGDDSSGSGTLDLNGHDATFKSLSDQAGSGVIILGNKNLSFTSSNSSGSYAGTFTGTGTLSFSDSGINESAAPLLVGDSSGFSGAVHITDAAVGIAQNTSLGTGTITLDSGELMPTSGATFTQNIVLAAGGGTLGGDYSNGTFSGTISGNGSLRINNGNSIITLTGTNTYQGGTIINGGTLAISADNNLGDSDGNITLNGGKLRTDAGITSSRNIALSSTAGNVINTHGNSSTFSGVLSDLSSDGSVQITGTGTSYGVGGGSSLTLSRANTYSGGTHIDHVDVYINNDNNLGTGDIGIDAATLALTADVSSSKGIGIFGTSAINTEGHTATLSGTIFGIFGSSGLRKEGNGALVLSATNTYQGGTTVNGGYVAANHATSGVIDAFGTGDVTLNDGAGLQSNLTGQLANNIAVTGSAAIAAQIGRTLTLTGGLTYSGGSGTTLHFGTSTDTGTVVLALASETSTSGGAISIDYGTVKLGSTGGRNLLADGGLSVTIQSNGTLDINGYSINLANISDLNGTITNSGGSTSTLLSTTTGTTTENNVIQDGASAVAIDKTGSGNLTLTAANTYSGGTHVENGTLTISNNSALGTGTLTMDEGTTLAINGGNHTIANNIVISGDPIFSPAHNTTQTFTGVISDGSSPGVLEMQGLGTLVLDGANTYTGGTVITLGTLSLGTNGSLAATGAVSVSSGATFDISSSSSGQTIGDLSGAGHVTLGSNGLTEGTSNDTTFSGVISGAGGTLVKQGTGMLILSGVNTYSGETTIRAGTLEVSSDDNLGSGDVTLDGGTLRYNRSILDTSIPLFHTIHLASTGAFDNADKYAVFGGAITGDGSIIFKGTGTTILAENSNTYTGSTTIEEGTVTEYFANGLSTNSAMIIGTSGTLDIGGGNQEVASLAGWGTVINSGPNATLTAGGNNTSTTFSGVLRDWSGQLAIEKTGTGTLTLSGTNTYSGGTTFTAGTVLVARDYNLGSGDLTFNGGRLSLDAGGGNGNNIVSTSKNITMTGNGTIVTVGNSELDVTGTLNGSGNLAVEGFSLEFETEGGNYSGNTTVSSGMLYVVHDSILGTGSITLSDSSLTVVSGGISQDIVSNGSTANNISISQSSTISGAISGGNLINISPESEFANGLITLSHDNSAFTGGFSVVGGTVSSGNYNGTLIIGAANNLGSGNLDLHDANLKTTADMTISNTLSLSDSGGAIDTDTHSVTLSNTVSGTSLAKSGSGKLILSRTNTYSDGTIVNGGFVTAAHATTGSIDGLGNGSVTLNDGTGLDSSVTGQLANTITVTDGATISSTAGHTLTLTGGLTYSGGSGTTLHFGTSTDTGTVVLALASESATSGGAISIDYGTVKIGNANSQSLLADNGVSVTIQSNGTLDLNGYGINIANVSDLGGTITNSGGSTSTLLSTTTDTTTENNVIQDGPSAVAIDKTGSGNLILTTANTYTGGTHIENGTLTISNNSALGTGTLTMDEGTILAFAGGSHTIANNIVISGDPTFDVANATTQTINGIIADGSSPGVLEKTGAGTLVLGGNNTYTGGTHITVGTLSIGAGGSLAATGAVSVSSGATFDISSGGDQTIGDLSGAGDVTLGGNQLTEGTSNDTTFSGVISGAGGTLVKQGSGNLTLSHANTYSGGTAIIGGNLSISADNQLGDSSGSVFISNSSFLRVTADLTSARHFIMGTDHGGIALQGHDVTLSGLISGTTFFVVNGQSGTGTLTLTHANTVSSIYIGIGGILAVSDDDQLGSGTLSMATGVLKTLSGLTSSRDVNLSAYYGTIDTNGFNSTFSGDFDGAGGFIKAGAGVLTMTGTGTYDGGTTISAGTLQIGNGGTTGSITGDVTDNAALIFDRSDNVVFAGAISGSGTLTQSGAGTLTLTATNTYTGGTTISSGTLQIGNGGTTGSISGNVTDDAVLSFDRSNNVVFAGVISGSGDVEQSGTGTTTLTNTNTYTGDTTISSGTLQIGNGGTTGSIATDVTDNANLVFNRSDSVTFSHIISGSGSVTQNGNGTLILIGINTYIGGTTISHGTLEVGDAGHASASLASGVTVASLGTLRGHGTINGDVSNTGTVAPGGSIGTLTINGNYTQASNGTLSIETSPTQTSLLSVSGTATLNGSLLITPDAGTYTKGAHYTIISASGITGTFTGVTNNAPNTVRFGISYTSTGVDLIAGASSFISAATTPNEVNVATMLDALSPNATGDFNTLVNDISALSPVGQQAAFDQLTGIAGASLSNISASNVRSVMSVVSSRLNGSSSGQGSEAPMLEAENREIQIADADPNYWGPAPVQPDNLTAWVQGFGDFNSIGNSKGAQGLSSTTGGGATGFEARYDVDDRLGIMAGAAKSSFSINGVAQSGTEKTYALGVYGSEGFFGGSQDDGIVVDEALIGAYNTATTKRTISTSNATARGTTDGYSLGVNVGAGYPIHFDEDMALTPHAGLSYTYNYTNSYTETGAAGANLHVASHDQNLLQSSVGFTLKHTYVLDEPSILRSKPLELFTPEIHAGWLHEILDPSSSVTSSINGVAGSSFTTSSVTPDRDAAIVGAGFAYDLLDSNISIFARYDATMSVNQSDHSVTAGIRYSW